MGWSGTVRRIDAWVLHGMRSPWTVRTVVIAAALVVLVSDARGRPSSEWTRADRFLVSLWFIPFIVYWVGIQSLLGTYLVGAMMLGTCSGLVYMTDLAGFVILSGALYAQAAVSVVADTVTRMSALKTRADRLPLPELR